MKFIKTCDKDKSRCEKCIKNRKSNETVKNLWLAFLDLPDWKPCDLFEEDDWDRTIHKEVEDFLEAKYRSQKESENCTLVFD